MQELLLHILETLNRADVRYCLLRDGHRLGQFAGGGEVDLLVAHDHFSRLGAVLSQFGFVRWRAWGHSPHHFFIAYHEPSDGWLKFDVVTEVAYGRPRATLRTALAENCLIRRRRHGAAFMPSPEDELVTLLLHCVLDKRSFAPLQRERLRVLRHRVSETRYLTELLRAYWSPETTWARIAAPIDSADWTALLARRRRVAAYLARGNRLATLGRHVRDRMLRKVDRARKALWPQAPMVAFLAPDGAGKSTLIAAICSSFWIPARSVYMGLWQRGAGVRGRWRWPAAGLARQLLTQWRRYLTARYHQARGRLVLFDRYPYDALLPPTRPLGRLRRWRRRLLAAACPAPGLVVMLDAPGEVLFARKGEHSAAVLERQRQGYLALQARIGRTIVVDATDDPQTVRRKVTAAIWHNTIHSTAREKRK